MANEVMILNSGNADDTFTGLETSYEVAGQVFIGRNKNGTDRKYYSAIRFQNVPITQGGCNYAGFYLWVQYNGKDESPRSGSWNFTIKAVDEDNTANFSGGSNPFGRSKTDAVESSNNGDEPDIGVWKEINVTGPVNEVLSRGGWSSGNSLALLFEATNDANENKYAGDGSDRKSFLVIRKSAEPDFTPSPTSVSAPTFPAAKNWGKKQAYPGKNVFTATDAELYETTKRRRLKTIWEGVINLTAGVTYNIAHNQGRRVLAEASVKSTLSSSRFKIPRYLPGGQVDPEVDNINGTIQVDNTNVQIIATDSCEAYVRIFLDDLVP